MRHSSPDLPADDPDSRPSKTQLKKQSHDLQALGESLAALSDERLNAMLADGTMDEPLREALREYKRTRSHEGRRRQMQFIGKRMRQSDAEALREAVAALQTPHARDTLALHEAERWREELAADDDAMTRWLAKFPASDAQHLRSLVRAARKDGALPPEQRHGRAWRELFQFVKKHMQDAQRAQEAQGTDPNGDE